MEEYDNQPFVSYLVWRIEANVYPTAPTPVAQPDLVAGRYLPEPVGAFEPGRWQDPRPRDAGQPHTPAEPISGGDGPGRQTHLRAHHSSGVDASGTGGRPALDHRWQQSRVSASIAHGECGLSAARDSRGLDLGEEHARA